MDSADEILKVLDRCCDAFTFPMLDNGYVYLAGTRLALYRSAEDWAMTIEVFGYSPRGGLPDTHIHTFASRLHDRDPRERYRDEAAYRNYLATHPNNESRFVYPVADGPWMDGELVADGATAVEVRGKAYPLPGAAEYAAHGIELSEAPKVCVYQVARWLAAVAREEVLATAPERRVSVPPELEQILQLEEWHHPNVIDDADRPSGNETFRLLAQVLETGDVSLYRPRQAPNTHWKHWPDGGTM